MPTGEETPVADMAHVKAAVQVNFLLRAQQGLSQNIRRSLYIIVGIYTRSIRALRKP
jgi:hypothetical protein